MVIKTLVKLSMSIPQTTKTSSLYTAGSKEKQESNHHLALDNRLQGNVTGDFKHPKAVSGSMAP